MVFFRTRNRLVQVAIGFGGASAAALYGLVLRNTTWQPISQLFCFVISWISFFGLTWLAFDIVNPFLIRAVAPEEVERETASFAEEVTTKLLTNQRVEFNVQDDLIKQEAINSIKAVLVDQVY
jgi:hypothetical protein